MGFFDNKSMLDNEEPRENRIDRRSLNMQPRKRIRVIEGVVIPVAGRELPHTLGRVPTLVTVAPVGSSGDTWRLTKQSTTESIWIQADSAFTANVTVEG
jgi:hypothetical protein